MYIYLHALWQSNMASLEIPELKKRRLRLEAIMELGIFQHAAFDDTG